jgi:hypothetical protein
MSTTAPKPPSRLSLLWIGLAGGATVCTWTLMAIAHFTLGGIAHDRLPVYISIGLSTIAATVWLGARYILQKTRRDSWWDGFAAGDEPLAEVFPIRDLKAFEGGAAPARHAELPQNVYWTVY